MRSGSILRFTLSYRDVEELLAERGLDISYETVRCWVLKFGPAIMTAKLRAFVDMLVEQFSTQQRRLDAAWDR